MDIKEKLLLSDERVYTVTEVSKKLKVSDSTVRKWIKKGLLKAVQVEKQYRVLESDLKEFLKTRQ